MLASAVAAGEVSTVPDGAGTVGIIGARGGVPPVAAPSKAMPLLLLGLQRGRPIPLLSSWLSIYLQGAKSAASSSAPLLHFVL